MDREKHFCCNRFQFLPFLAFCLLTGVPQLTAWLYEGHSEIEKKTSEPIFQARLKNGILQLKDKKACHESSSQQESIDLLVKQRNLKTSNSLLYRQGEWSLSVVKHDVEMRRWGLVHNGYTPDRILNFCNLESVCTVCTQAKWPMGLEIITVSVAWRG